MNRREAWEELANNGLVDKNPIKQSKVTQEVVRILKSRDEMGWKKYGNTLEDSKRNQCSLRLQDLQEELIDSIQYVTSILLLINQFKSGPDNPKRREAYVRSLAEKLLS